MEGLRLAEVGQQMGLEHQLLDGRGRGRRADQQGKGEGQGPHGAHSIWLWMARASAKARCSSWTGWSQTWRSALLRSS
jgi:hypothetical protein